MLKRRLQGLRVPLGVQFFMAAIVMGSLALYMAVSTMGSAADANRALDELEPTVELSADSDLEIALTDARSVLAANRSRGLVLAVIVAGIGLGAASFLTVAVGRKASRLAVMAQDLADRELPEFARAISGLADGDLTVDYEVQVEPMKFIQYDEMGDIGEAFNNMVESLEHVAGAFGGTVESIRDIIGETVNVAESLRSGSVALAAASDESADIATRVAISTTDIADGAQSQSQVIDRLTTGVGHIVEAIAAAGTTIRGVDDASTEAFGAAERGRSQVARANDAMQSIKASFSEVRGSVDDLGAHSQRVDEIVELIRTIADQTNLLALNAAIEAARAGEMGRGFAVVAAEVKALAEEAAASTDAIAAIVDEMMESVGHTVAAVQTGSDQVDTGSQVVAEAGEAFGEIAVWIERTSREISELNSMAASIESAAANIRTGTEEISSVTAGNTSTAANVAAASEEAAASAQELGATAHQLSSTAGDLENAISRFRCS